MRSKERYKWGRDGGRMKNGSRPEQSLPDGREHFCLRQPQRKPKPNPPRTPSSPSSSSWSFVSSRINIPEYLLFYADRNCELRVLDWDRMWDFGILIPPTKIRPGTFLLPAILLVLRMGFRFLVTLSHNLPTFHPAIDVLCRQGFI